MKKHQFLEKNWKPTNKSCTRKLCPAMRRDAPSKLFPRIHFLQVFLRLHIACCIHMRSPYITGIYEQQKELRKKGVQNNYRLNLSFFFLTKQNKTQQWRTMKQKHMLCLWPKSLLLYLIAYCLLPPFSDFHFSLRITSLDKCEMLAVSIFPF